MENNIENKGLVSMIKARQPDIKYGESFDLHDFSKNLKKEQ